MGFRLPLKDQDPHATGVVADVAEPRKQPRQVPLSSPLEASETSRVQKRSSLDFSLRARIRLILASLFEHFLSFLHFGKNPK